MSLEVVEISPGINKFVGMNVVFKRSVEHKRCLLRDVGSRSASTHQGGRSSSIIRMDPESDDHDKEKKKRNTRKTKVCKTEDPL
jgi:hypothetical protein